MADSRSARKRCYVSSRHPGQWPRLSRPGTSTPGKAPGSYLNEDPSSVAHESPRGSYDRSPGTERGRAGSAFVLSAGAAERPAYWS